VRSIVRFVFGTLPIIRGSLRVDTVPTLGSVPIVGIAPRRETVTILGNVSINGIAPRREVIPTFGTPPIRRTTSIGGTIPIVEAIIEHIIRAGTTSIRQKASHPIPRSLRRGDSLRGEISLRGGATSNVVAPVVAVTAAPIAAWMVTSRGTTLESNLLGLGDGVGLAGGVILIVIVRISGVGFSRSP
jgi:hypothetical protein